MTGSEFAARAEGLKSLPFPEIPDTVPGGDMPGDVIKINEGHIAKAKVILSRLSGLLEQASEKSDKVVISVFGGSGVGKSEIASLLGFCLESGGIGSYVLSGDNYPRRIPLYNDAERASVFRAAGLKGLVNAGLYSEEVKSELLLLWDNETDPDPKLKSEYPWLAVYQDCGRKALSDYLGTSREQDYDEINAIIRDFKAGKDLIYLKRMGRTENERWYSQINFTDINVLIIEWTHGGNAALEGIDIPILLNSTPEETKEHRRLRARDGKTDSAFTTMVLEIEQAELDSRAHTALIRISKAGELMT